MALNTEELLMRLQSDDPNYAETAALVGAEALPELERLARDEEDPWLAAKATHLASRIGAAGAREVVEAGAEHLDPVVRVAAAAALGRLWEHDEGFLPNPDAPGGVLDRLLHDNDPGVRKFALTSAAAMGLRHRLQTAEESDPEEFIRIVARELLEGGA